MAAHREDLVTALESSLQACVSLFLATDNVEKGRELDNANTHGVEANIKRFLEAAKMLEADFLRKQMYSRVNHPEEVTKEVHFTNSIIFATKFDKSRTSHVKECLSLTCLIVK
ncbi:mediator of RNA polymerase II transcription subunit 28-like isoform X2 [Acropora palmata]|uniref:mediator of RNA polymerase II transcription subunit 28-like isoform X2 n=1 Tax=Acropora palmata TaxID=6131 RepID=UPI003DA07AFE